MFHKTVAEKTLGRFSFFVKTKLKNVRNIKALLGNNTVLIGADVRTLII